MTSPLGPSDTDLIRSAFEAGQAGSVTMLMLCEELDATRERLVRADKAREYHAAQESQLRYPKVPVVAEDAPDVEKWRAKDAEIILVAWGFRRLLSASYEGGYGGTCYECPFATPPLERSGREADWHEVANDPTEAYFRCGLPSRQPETGQRAPEWGEYAPCTVDEWLGWLNAAVKDRGVVVDLTQEERQAMAEQEARDAAAP